MRIATDSIYANVLRNLQKNQTELDRLNQQISSGRLFRFPHEEPVKAAQSMQLRTDILRLKKFNDNIGEAKGVLEASDAALSNAVDLLQRAREIAIQGATGTLTESDRSHLALEVEQVLEEMVSAANSEFEGKFIFSGSETLNETFNESPFVVDRVGGHIVKVKYKGDRQDRLRQIAEGKFISASVPGNKVFAGANQSVTMGFTGVTDEELALSSAAGIPSKSRSGYLRLDGTLIYYDVSRDSLRAIADRVNQAGIEVQASVVTLNSTKRLKLETTNPHQMELLDIDTGTATTRVDGLLDDLQIVEGTAYSTADPNQPDNIDPTAIESNVSVFQSLINLRDDLDIRIGLTNPDFVKRYGADTNGDGVGDLAVPPLSAIMKAPLKIGGSSLSNLDAALDNILSSRAVFGARVNRLDAAEGRNTDFENNSTQLLQRVEDLDFAKALTEFQQQQNVQKAALATGARIFSLTLLDFL
ncbi:MAG: flagellar hook-associated protein 3 [Candidatus Lindowbacteria bacterium RIFCSPLOWO2_12_FULL_62_27]|nr:MAG: flagellar hook-associated protein 3 [Candidatus Lindowbacteria bacterium RIFCSPLOWO2_12_FULL_62_27]OGH61514.1 MAG: flagellar hook-associated protein 3 [Candidatus Lindowbacteria bacterium RIFCSPLOWO2_02_FULL_62_12]